MLRGGMGVLEAGDRGGFAEPGPGGGSEAAVAATIPAAGCRVGDQRPPGSRMWGQGGAGGPEGLGGTNAGLSELGLRGVAFRDSGSEDTGNSASGAIRSAYLKPRER